MSSRPMVSVIVPTCGRPAALRRLIRALAAQTAADPFELVIVADGVRAADTGVGDPRSWPFPVRVVEGPRQGAAAARNIGASHASGELLMFLDDDVEPAASAIAAHVSFHRRRSGAIGAGGLTPQPTHGGYVGSALAGWWEVMDDALLDPRHRYTFRDLLTGHLSMSRDTFARVGEFDVSLRCHEDFDFGYRAIRAGFAIRYVPGALARHHDESDLDKILRRKFDEGIADVQLVAKFPELLHALPLGRSLSTERLAARVQASALRKPSGGSTGPRLLRLGMALFERLSMRDKWRWALERTMDYWYWRGVRTEIGSADAVHTLRAREPQRRPFLDVDLTHGLEHAERHIDEHRPEAIRVVLEQQLVCELPYQPGAEPLRGLHLRPLLLKGYWMEFARACGNAGYLPSALLAQVPVPVAPATESAGAAPGCAA